jgi:hypothetical protein
MRTSKKFIAGLSAFALAVSSAVITVSAVDVETDSTDFTISVVSSTDSVSAKDTFSVDVVLSNVPDTGIAGFEFAVTYDNTALTLQSVVENADIVGEASDKELDLVPELGDTMVNTGADYSCFDYYDNQSGKIACMWATGLEDSSYWINQDGVLVTLTFTVNESISTDNLEFGIGSILDGGNVVFAGSGDNGYYAYDTVSVEDPVVVDVDTEGGATTTTTEGDVTQPSVETTTAEEEVTTTSETEPSGEVTTASDTEPSEEVTTASDTEPSGEVTTASDTEPSEEVTTTANGGVGDSNNATLLGDANLDGNVKANDLLLVKKHVLGIGTLEGQGLINSDINGDGNVKANDLLLIKKFILGIVASLG